MSGAGTSKIEATFRGRQFWDKPGRIEELRKLWHEGKSCTEVGKVLGCSRAAVMGKVHRLGIQERSEGYKAKVGLGMSVANAGRPQTRAPRLAICGNNTVFEKTETTVIVDKLQDRGRDALGALDGYLPPAETITPWNRAWRLETLPAKHCKWPIGDPRAEDFAWCGHPVTPEGDTVPNYCDHHRVKHSKPGSAQTPKDRERQLRRHLA